MAAKRSRRRRALDDHQTLHAHSPAESADEPWSYVGLPEGRIVGQSALRVLVVAMVAVVLAVGLLTVVGQAVGLFARGPATAAAGAGDGDLNLAGTAMTVALDFLTWDQRDRDFRATVVAAWGMPSTAADGWDGSGQLVADAAAPVAVQRDGDRAVVTVRTRIRTGGGQPRWVLVAVPLAVNSAAQVVLTGSPKLVGSPAIAIPDPWVGTADDASVTPSEDAVQKVMTAYATGDLEYVRGPGTDFSGLNGVVSGGQVLSWRVASSASGGDVNRRSGQVLVLWSLPNGGGAVRCAYRLELVDNEGRWLLAAITPEVEPLS